MIISGLTLLIAPLTGLVFLGAGSVLGVPLLLASLYLLWVLAADGFALARHCASKPAIEFAVRRTFAIWWAVAAVPTLVWWGWVLTTAEWKAT